MYRNPKIVIVIPAKNSEKYISRTIKSLRNQTIKPDQIIVVDDGSNDNTYKISVKNGAQVIQLKDIGYYAVGRPHLAKVINVGIKKALKYYPDYIMISGSDDAFSSNYIEELIKIMVEHSSIIITSGYIVGEAYDYNSPRGSGRIIKTSSIKRIGFYPLNYGWETYMLFKAKSLGYKTLLFKIPFYSQRSSYRNPIKYYFIGKGMKALGYPIEYAIGRSIMLYKFNEKGAIFMLKGYFSKVKKYKDINKFTKAYYRKIVINYLLNPIKYLNYLKSIIQTIKYLR